MQHHGFWIRIFYRKVHFHGSSFVESHLSLWQITYLVTCHLTTRVWLSSHQFPSPTHGCCVFLFYSLSLWKLIVTFNALLRRRILSSAVKEKWHTNIFMFLSCVWKSLSCVQLFATPWTAACQTPLSMKFSRQEYWSGLLCPPPEDLPNPDIKPRSPALQADSLLTEPPGKPKNTGAGSLSLLQGIFPTQGLKPGLPHCRQILYQLSYEESPDHCWHSSIFMNFLPVFKERIV